MLTSHVTPYATGNIDSDNPCFCFHFGPHGPASSLAFEDVTMKCFRILLLVVGHHVPGSRHGADDGHGYAGDPTTAEADPDARVDALQPDFDLAALPTTLRMPVHKLGVPGHAPVQPAAWRGGLRRSARRTSSASIRGRRLDSSFDMASPAARRSGFIGRATGRSSCSASTTSGRSGMTSRWGSMRWRRSRAGTTCARRYKSALGIVASRNVGRWAALYAEPFYVVNSNPAADQGSDNNTLMVGFGGRLRIRSCNLPGRRDHAAAHGVRAGCEPNELRPGGARGRAPVPAEYFERVRDDAGADCRRRLHERQLVHRIQHRAEVFLRRAIGRKSCL